MRKINTCEEALRREDSAKLLELTAGWKSHLARDHPLAEMQTGEGKTLVATLPVFLNSLTGLGVHVVTVNDYLAAGGPAALRVFRAAGRSGQIRVFHFARG